MRGCGEKPFTIGLDKAGKMRLDRPMNIYDTTVAAYVEIGDQILVHNDPIEVHSVLDEGDSVVIKGYSHMSGDEVTYILTADSTVELWAI